AGSASQGITFTPTDTANYTTVSGTASVTVNKATPSVTAWPTASAITYGQTLASSTLSGGSATPAGSFAFTTTSTAPGAGSASQAVAFTPTDTANYTSATDTVSVTVSKATPTVSTWPTASAITTVGQALSTSTLSGGSASVAGGFTFASPATTPPAGNYAAALTFAPTDTDNFNTVAGSTNVVVGLSAVDDTLDRSSQGLTKIAVAQLLANDSDPLGRTLTLSSVSALSGGTVTLSGRWITFSPATGLADATPASFSYVLANGTGSSASATVTLTVPGASYTTSPTTQLGGVVNNPDGGKILTFAAVPNFAYQVETSANLINWTPLGSITAGADGRLVIIDTGATEAARFYRFKK
ncbi:MAG: Ig-like domain-containing protein, partial [Verrucomicrobiota bacterium]